MTGTARRIARPLCLFVAACAFAVSATPNLPLEDPVYLQLEQLRAAGKLPAYLGGARPLTEAEVQRLLAQAGAAPDPRLLPPDVSSAWLRPATLVTLCGAFTAGLLIRHTTLFLAPIVPGALILASLAERMSGSDTISTNGVPARFRSIPDTPGRPSCNDGMSNASQCRM